MIAVLSAQPCWEGKPAVVLPFMGFVLFNGRVMSYFFLPDVLDAGRVRVRRKTLAEHLHQMISWSFSDHTINGFVYSLRGFRLQCVRAWNLTVETQQATFCHVCRDLTQHANRYVICIQRLFRRRQLARNRPQRMLRFSMIRQFLASDEAGLLPIEIAHIIRDVVIGSANATSLF
jgi:hypothetical protein